ncbi:MAG: hypothetical protein NTV19_12555 [Burkholderiales bacterium]|nr:hypothetical protein [Burkholderiales bacterium]
MRRQGAQRAGGGIELERDVVGIQAVAALAHQHAQRVLADDPVQGGRVGHGEVGWDVHGVVDCRGSGVKAGTIDGHQSDDKDQSGWLTRSLTLGTSTRWCRIGAWPQHRCPASDWRLRAVAGSDFAENE